MRALVEFLARYKDHVAIYSNDKLKIQKTLDEFAQEISKVSNPIVEKFDKVERRVIQPNVNNPSD